MTGISARLNPLILVLSNACTTTSQNIEEEFILPIGLLKIEITA